jgi:SET and MYND domain-containing protein
MRTASSVSLERLWLQLTTDRDAALSQLATLVPALSTRVPPSAHPLLPLLRLWALQLTPPAPDQRELVLGLLGKAAEGARNAHPPNHPTVGVILAERAKIMSMDSGEERTMVDVAGLARRRGELVAAVAALREAAAACEVGFGGGDVAKSMRELVGECERELDMMRG